MAIPFLVLLTTLAPAWAQLQCVQKEYAQYKDQARTADGRYNLPIDYCISEIRQRMFASTSRPYAECSSEMSKMKDAMLGAKQPKLVSFAEGGCKGEHPLRKPKS